MANPSIYSEFHVEMLTNDSPLKQNIIFLFRFSFFVFRFYIVNKFDHELYNDVHVLILLTNVFELLHLNVLYEFDDIVNDEVFVDHEHNVRKVWRKSTKHSIKRIQLKFFHLLSIFLFF